MSVFVIGIAGPSGSGKSHLASALAGASGEDRCVVLSLDAYYRDLSDLPETSRAAVDFDRPAAIDGEAVVAAVRALKAGQAIEVPTYDFRTHSRIAPAKRREPRPYLIIEGLFVLGLRSLAEECDLTVYVDADADLCLKRRLARDVSERGRDEAEVRGRFEAFVRPSIVRDILPQREVADVVVDGGSPIGEMLAICLPRLPMFEAAGKRRS